MVISAEPAPPPPPDPVADAAVAAAVEAAAATSNARQAAFSSFPSLKTWGSHRVLRCAHVKRAGDAIATATARATARRSPEKLQEVREELLCHLREMASADAADADAAAAAAEAEAAGPEPAASRPWKLRTRRRPAMTPSASASPPPERRPSRARAEALDRPRFSVTLTSEEIEEDIYAVTGARARRRPRRRPRAVQKQVDVSPLLRCLPSFLLQGPICNFVKSSSPDAISRLVAVGDHRRVLPGAGRSVKLSRWLGHGRRSSKHRPAADEDAGNRKANSPITIRSC
ncbi:hypothetical protein ACP70R_030404 [Stipagrostis hirtigluma subsp. patula]